MIQCHTPKDADEEKVGRLVYLWAEGWETPQIFDMKGDVEDSLTGGKGEARWVQSKKYPVRSPGRSVLGDDDQKPMFLYSTPSAYALVSLPTDGLDMSQAEESRKLEHQHYSPAKLYRHTTNDEQPRNGDYLSSPARNGDEQDQGSHDSFADGLGVTPKPITGRAVHSPSIQEEDSLLAGLMYTPENEGSGGTMMDHSGDAAMEVDDTFNYVRQKQVRTQIQNKTGGATKKRERWR
jgi:hypothetical protein